MFFCFLKAYADSVMFPMHSYNDKPVWKNYKFLNSPKSHTNKQMEKYMSGALNIKLL